MGLPQDRRWVAVGWLATPSHRACVRVTACVLPVSAPMAATRQVEGGSEKDRNERKTAKQPPWALVRVRSYLCCFLFLAVHPQLDHLCSLKPFAPPIAVSFEIPYSHTLSIVSHAGPANSCPSYQVGHRKRHTRHCATLCFPVAEPGRLDPRGKTAVFGKVGLAGKVSLTGRLGPVKEFRKRGAAAMPFGHSLTLTAQPWRFRLRHEWGLPPPGHARPYAAGGRTRGCPRQSRRNRHVACDMSHFKLQPNQGKLVETVWGGPTSREGTTAANWVIPWFVVSMADEKAAGSRRVGN